MNAAVIGKLSAINLNGYNATVLKSFCKGIAIGTILFSAGTSIIDHINEVHKIRIQTEYMTPSNILTSIQNSVDKGELTIQYIASNDEKQAFSQALSNKKTKAVIGCNFGFGTDIHNEFNLGVQHQITIDERKEFIAIHEQAHCATSKGLLGDKLYYDLINSLDAKNTTIKNNKPLYELAQTQAKESFSDSFAYLIMVAKHPHLEKTLGPALLKLRIDNYHYAESKNKFDDHNSTLAVNKAIKAWKNISKEDKIEIRNSLKNKLLISIVEEKIANIASKITVNSSQEWMDVNLPIKSKPLAKIPKIIDYSKDLVINIDTPQININKAHTQLKNIRINSQTINNSGTKGASI